MKLTTAAACGIAAAAVIGLAAGADDARAQAPVDTRTQPTFGTTTKPVPKRPTLWPMKPFAKPRPLRAHFGEARSLQIPRNGLKGEAWHHYLYSLNPVGVHGPRIIHDGIDIAAKYGTPVYAMENGRVSAVRKAGAASWVRVGNYRYDHIKPAVRKGQKVRAFKTVLGRIITRDNHLHLTRYHKGVPVNPLAFGGMVGYKDTGRPWLGELMAFSPEGALADQTNLNGKIALAVRANDRMSASPVWKMRKTGVMPASQLRELEAMGQNDFGRGGLYTLDYAIETELGQTVLGPFRVLQADVRPPAWAGNMLYTTPSNKNDWVNRFWYRLTLQGPDGDGFLDTGHLAPGRYWVRVTGADVSGNSTTEWYPIGVHTR